MPLILSHPCHSGPPCCSQTELFIQAMLGGVSGSQGHPVLQLLLGVCFSSRISGICLGWGKGEGKVDSSLGLCSRGMNGVCYIATVDIQAVSVCTAWQQAAHLFCSRAILLHQIGCDFSRVCLFICLSVCMISQKVTDVF